LPPRPRHRRCPARANAVGEEEIVDPHVVVQEDQGVLAHFFHDEAIERRGQSCLVVLDEAYCRVGSKLIRASERPATLQKFCPVARVA